MHSRKPTIYGPDGRPVARARDRLAPKPNQRAGLEGWVSWRLIDRKGNKVAGGEQHNLILNSFLDEIAAAAMSSHDWMTHAAVGTGSAAPTVADTALSAQVARTSTLSDAGATTRLADGEYEMTRTWEFDFADANGNLTEFGFARGASSNLMVRELFRDGGGNPITVTKTSDYKLRITYAWTLALTPVWSTPGSFTISGIGVINGNYGFTLGSSGANIMSDLAVFSSVAAGASSGSSGAPAGDARPSPVLPTSYSSAVNWAGATTVAARTPNSYTPGDYSRSVAVTYTTSDLNGMVAALGLTQQYGADRRPGFVFVIDPGDRFTKDSGHTLTIDDLLTVSWGRA